MSVAALSWVLESSKSKGTDRLVMVVLADHAGKDDWVCYPSIERIAAMANASESAVHRSLRSLVELGELTVERQGSFDARIRRDRRPNLYRLNGVSLATPGTPYGVSLANERGAKSGLHGVPPVAPKPRKEPSMNRDGFSRMPLQRPDCPDCDGTTRTRDENGDYTRDKCGTCA